MRYLILFLALVPAWAQRESYGNVGNQYAKFDMSAALSSRPVPEKASDPGTCTEGMRYYNTTSHKGRLCTGTNTWADEAGSGSAATLSTPRAIYGNNFDGSAALAQIIASTYGGTGNGFTKFSGPATAEKTFTLPNASATILTSNTAVTVAQGGTGATTLTGPLKGNGTSAFSAAAYTDLVALWASGSCSGFLKNDGTCAAAGSGTVTVVSSGSLTSTALVTGGGTTTLQTPSATATLDSSGNISTPGSISTGAGGSAAGALQMTQGTAPSAGTTAITLHAPASVTSYRMVLPGTSPTGFMRAADSSNVSTITASALAVADMPTVMKTRSFTMVIPGTGASNVLQDTDDQPAVWYNSLGQGIHITGVSCITDSATATTIQLQKNDGSPTNMLSSNLSCSSTRASTTGFVSTEDAVASTNGLDFLIVSAGGAGKWVSVTVTYTLD